MPPEKTLDTCDKTKGYVLNTLEMYRKNDDPKLTNLMQPSKKEKQTWNLENFI